MSIKESNFGLTVIRPFFLRLSLVVLVIYELVIYEQIVFHKVHF